MRPGVVWFGEPLPQDTLDTVEDWINAAETVDLMLVIGTSSKVYPAAGYVERARAKGARVAVVNTEAADADQVGISDNDWFFQGDASEIVPMILEEFIGREWDKTLQ